jgi:hypothetical protein
MPTIGDGFGTASTWMIEIPYRTVKTSYFTPLPAWTLTILPTVCTWF